jgi:putative phage-type endonuclease
VKPLIKIIDKRKMSEADWQEYREQQQNRLQIGGSDIATILGVNPYKSKFTLWLEMTGQKPKDKVENEAVEWGNLLEPVVRDKFRRATGFKVMKNNFVLQHDIHEFMVANIDGEVIDPAFNGRGVLEIKTTREHNKKEWEDGCPISYMAQVQWYLGVTGYEYAYICVLIGGSTFKYFLIERDDYLIDTMIAHASNFIANVKQRVAPEIGGSKSESEWLAQTFPEAMEEEVTIPPTIEDMAIEYTELQKQIKEMTARCEEIKNQIKLEGKDFKTLRGISVKISMPTIKKTLFDAKAFQKDHADLYQKYKTKQSSYRGFDVTLLVD